MTAIGTLKPTGRPLVMDLVAEAGLDVSEWANFKGSNPATNPKYCYEWVFNQVGMPSVACLWLGDLELAPDGSVRYRLNLWEVAKTNEAVAGRSVVAKRARALDMALQSAFRNDERLRVIVVDGEQADLVAQTARSSTVERRKLDTSTWTVSQYDWTNGDCLLIRDEPIDASGAHHDGGTDSDGLAPRDSLSASPTYVARLAFNSSGWRRPALSAEVQEADDTYRSVNGFGHEDWIFRNEWELDGWRYAFVQGVNRSRARLLREGVPFNLRLFTMPAAGDRRAIAEIREVECLDDLAADSVVEAYERLGWLNTMRAEVVAAGGRPDALDETGYSPHILNMRFRVSDVRMLDAGVPIASDDPVSRLTRYGLYRVEGAMDSSVGPGAPYRISEVTKRGALTSSDYREAFERFEFSDIQRRWLVAHYYSPSSTTSMLKLAAALGYPDHRAANGAYGALAHKVANELPRPPEDLDDGVYVDWLAALAQLVERDESGHSQWRLRDEVAQAMLAMGWVESVDASDIDDIDTPSPDDQRLARQYELDDTQIRQMMLSRRGHGRFRTDTLRFWGGRCAVSGLSDSCFLVASHIKPWRRSNPNERLDGFNGLPLTPNLDRAFDRGFVSFATDGAIMLAPFLSAQAMKALGITRDMTLRFLDERIEPYLAFHRQEVFKSTR